MLRSHTSKVSWSLGEFLPSCCIIAITTATMYETIFPINKICKGSNNNQMIAHIEDNICLH